MRFLLVLLAVLSGLVMPQMAAATRAQVAGMGSALPEEVVASPQPEVCLVPASIARRGDPIPHRQQISLPTFAAISVRTVTLSDCPLE